MPSFISKLSASVPFDIDVDFIPAGKSNKSTSSKVDQVVGPFMKDNRRVFSGIVALAAIAGAILLIRYLLQED